MWGAAYSGTFNKITSASDLVTGYYVVVGSESATSNADMAMGATVSSGRMTGVAVTFDQTGKTSITNPDNAIVWYVTVSGTTCTFKNMSTSTYLSNSSTTSGKGMSLAAASSNFTFDGYNTTSPIGFKFSSSQSSNNYIKYNTGSQWFSNYASGYSATMTPFRMYKLNESNAVKLGTPTGMTTGSVTTSSARLSWNAVSNASSYKVKVGDTEYDTSNTYYDLTGLTQVSDYSWSVKAIGDGESYSDGDYCDVVSFTTTANGSTSVIDFENAIDTYTDWTMTNLSKVNADITAYKGDYFGSNGSSTTASITTKDKVLAPQYLKFYVSKRSGNTTASTWKVQVSEDGSAWTDVASISACGMEKGVWQPLGVDLSSYEDVYVRIYYASSGAARAIDQVTLVYSDVEQAETPVITPADGTEFSTATKEVSISAADGATIYYTLDGTTPNDTKTLYEGAFNISATTTVKAIAYETDKRPSAVASATITYVAPVTNYDINCTAPVGGTYTVKVGNEEVQTVTAATVIDGGEGKTITLTSTPSAGYKLASTPFVVTDEDDANVSVSTAGGQYSFIMPGKNVTITAQFTRVYTISAGSCENGSITAIKDKDDAVITETSYRSKVVVEATADTHYHLTGMYYVKEGDDAHNEIGENEGVYSFTMPQSNVTVYATFADDTQYTISWMVNGAEAKSEQVYADVPVSAPAVDPVAGKVFRGWVAEEIEGTTDETPSYVNVTNLTVDEDKVFYAVFATEEGTPETHNIITYQTENFPSSYAAAADYTLNGVSFNIVQAYVTGQKTQWRAAGNSNGTGTMYNNDAMSISKITLTYDNSDTKKNFVVKVGNNANPTSGTEITGVVDANNSNVYVFDCSSENASYFVLTNGEYAGYLASIDITCGGATYSGYCTTVTPRATITLNAACHDTEGKVYSTYSNTSAWVVPAELTVSEVGVVDGKLVVESYKTSDVVPANTGVMVAAAKGGDYVVDIETDPELLELAESVLGEDNCLRPSGAEGITADAMTAADADCTYYRLTMHNGTQIGFWWGAADGAAFDLAANKAYLAVPTSAGSNLRGLWFGGDDTLTGIEAVETATDSAIYNLQGQRIQRLQQGVNIINGRKVIR